MGLFKNWAHLFIVNLVCWLGWFSGLVFGQFGVSQTVSGSVSFPVLGLTCVGNLAVFISSFLRGRLYWEIGAKDVLATLMGPKLRKIKGMEDIDGFALTTFTEGLGIQLDCSVVMLTKELPNRSMRQFVEYIANVYDVRAVVGQYFPLHSLPLTLQICTCAVECKCIVFWPGVDEGDSIVRILADRMPGAIKRVSDSQCLLPCSMCLKNGCHGCNQGMLHLERHSIFREGDSQVEPPTAVSGALNSKEFGRPDSCICIPVRRASDDDWTELLITSFKCKHNFTQGALVTRGNVSASRALENYMDGSGRCYAADYYSTASVIVPRLTEILINFVLTFWFKQDGFSSALVARRSVKQYILDDTGRGFAASVFMTRAIVYSNDSNTNVCQLLVFRGNRLTFRTLSLVVGCVNLICSISWGVMVGLEGGTNKWYDTKSISPSEARVYAIMAIIVVTLGMDCIDMYSYWQLPLRESQLYRRKTILTICVIILEVVCVVSGSAIARTLGMRFFGRWIYSALQCFVWVKWGVGSYLVGHYSTELDSLDFKSGMYLYSSPFLLNAMLAGVRAKW